MYYLKKGESTLPITDVHTYRADNGKNILSVNCDSSVGFSTIQDFFSEIANYDYYAGEDGQEELITTYTQYGIDVEIHYIKAGSSYSDDGTLIQSSAYYNIEVVRDPSIDASITAIQGSISNLTTQINALSDFKDDTESELLTTQMALVEQYESSLVMEETLETTQDELTAAQIALTEQYEANIELEAELADTKLELATAQEELLNAQLALTELYEIILGMEGTTDGSEGTTDGTGSTESEVGKDVAESTVTE